MVKHADGFWEYIKPHSIIPGFHGEERILLTDAMLDACGGKNGLWNRLVVLDKVHGEFMAYGRSENWRLQQSYERLLKDLYTNQKAWFDGLLASEKNARIADCNYYLPERVGAMIGTLTMIYRQSGEYAKCEKVLTEMYIPIIDRHTEFARIASMFMSFSLHSSNLTMTYKLDQIALNLYLKLGYMERCIFHFRRNIKFELETNKTWEHSYQLPFLTEELLSKSQKKRARKHMKTLPKYLQDDAGKYGYVRVPVDMLDEISDSKYRKIMNMFVLMASGEKPLERYQQRRFCEACGQQEAEFKQFKMCGRCKKVTYCSTDCQRCSWKGMGHCAGRVPHKKTCEAAKKPIAEEEIGMLHTVLREEVEKSKAKVLPGTAKDLNAVVLDGSFCIPGMSRAETLHALREAAGGGESGDDRDL